LSSNAFLTVVTPPTNQTASAGSNVTFTVSASSLAATILYRWQFNGSDIPGATDTSLTLTNVQPSDAGSYGVVVTVVANGIAPATFTASLNVLSSLTLSEPAILPDGSFQMRLQGIPNRNYGIDSSPDLTNWSQLNILPYTNGAMPFVDTAATNHVQRFYRARLLP
jgi:hypothetical protein